MTSVLHVHPADDLIDHDTSTAEPECVCGPEVGLVIQRTGWWAGCWCTTP